MAELTLKEFLKTNTQAKAAEALGCNQSAVSQMLSYNRDIRFRTDIDGNVVETFEVKQPGRKK